MTHTPSCMALAVSLALVACGGDDGSSSEKSFDELARPVVADHAKLVFQSYSAAHAGAVSLDDACKAFVAAPDEAKLTAARQAWLASRPAYLETEVFRFYGGPIDDDDGPEPRINAWPMDEAYVDYVEGDDDAGIVNQPNEFPNLDAEALMGANLVGGETNVATGYHAIEFLLWGQDLSATGPGARPASDYLASGSHPNHERRADYLKGVSALLLEDLASVRDEWAADANNYRKTFLALPAKEAIGLILTGMGSLSGAELGGERMKVAWDTKSQEDEHSCFSDNTHVDHLGDQLGIENVYLGRQGGTDGPGLDDLVRAKDPALDDEMKQRMADAKAAIEAIPKPFDQAIVGDDSAPGRVKIKAAIEALEAQTATIAKIAILLGVKLNLQ